MERGQEERSLSTADLAERGAVDAESDREREMPAAVADETSRSSTRDETASGPAAMGPAPGTSDPDADASPLFEAGQMERFQNEWETIQTGFVDEPRRAVERADALVADLMQRLAISFAEERSELEAHWDRGDDVSTEDLRVALRRYRSFFGRLLQA